MTETTQMAAARRGILTPQLKNVLANESISQTDLLAGVAAGTIVVPANKHHSALAGCGIGQGLTTKINVNLGVSADCNDIDLELQKARISLEMQAHSIMDLSTVGDTNTFRRRLVGMSPAMIGTVPVYDAVARYGGRIAAISIDQIFENVETHARAGVDFMTIHAGLTTIAVERLRIRKRLTHVVSRGGSILLEWMHRNDCENPFYTHFDRLLEICRRYDVTLSLGDGLRPGCLKDATDAAQVQELILLGELTLRAREQDVQVMIEGPGHVPLNEIATNMQLAKKLCHGAPLYVLGPIVTDVAPGYDHITSAIGGALAAASGADFLCYVTPAEHLRLPDLADIREGIVAARIAAHAADVAQGIGDAMNWDNRMSQARKDLDWERMLALSMDPEKARRYRISSLPENESVCTMCGDLCALKRSRTIMEGQ